MSEQEPERPASLKNRAALLALNRVPWSTQTAFGGVLWTLIPWIGFTLILNAIGGNAGLTKPLSLSEDIQGAIVGVIFSLIVEGAFLIAPCYFANKVVVANEGESRVVAILRALGLRRFNVLRTLLWIIGLLVLVVAASDLYGWLLSVLNINLQTNSQVLQQYSTYEPLTTWAVLISSVFIAPFCEEIFFRGFVFAGLLHDISPRWAIIISAALFAVAHADLGSFVPLFVIGLALGFLRWRTGSTWASMSLHILNNLLASGEIILYMTHHIVLPF